MKHKFSDNTNNPGSSDFDLPDDALASVTLTSTELDRERMICRLVDDVTSSEDWRRLAMVAGTDPTIFADLADTRRHGEQLSTEMMRQVCLADGVTLGLVADGLAAGHQFGETIAVGGANDADDEQPVRTNGLSLPGRWKLGWAVAAALGLLCLSQFVNSNNRITSSGGGVKAAGLVSVGSAEQALDAYYKLGREAGSVVTEVPQRYVLDSRTLPDGRQEVLFLRQVVERAIVTNVYKVGSDEQGRPVLVPLAPATSAGPAL